MQCDARFIGREVSVKTEDEKGVPVSFVLEKQEHKIAEILESWPDYGFGRKVSGQTKWWQRHHRFYYKVKTDTGETYEIYSDRKVSTRSRTTRKWYASRKY